MTFYRKQNAADRDVQEIATEMDRPPALRPLGTPTTLRGAVVEQLRTAILSGELAPGALLKEVEIARLLGVSTTPVREAMAELASEGLVDIEPNRLRRVAPLDVPAMMDLLRVQTALWRLGYQWSLVRQAAIDTGRLEAALQEFELSLGAGNRLQVMRAAHDFHTIIVQAAGSPELLRVTLDRRALMARFIVLHASPLISQAALDQHRALFDAVRQRRTSKVLKLFDQLSNGLTGLVLKKTV